MRFIGVALFASFLIVSLPAALRRSIDCIELARHQAGETALAQRTRVWGAPYTLAIEGIRRAIPRDGVYALVNGDAVDMGAPIWIRFDLAPRRAVLLGGAAELRDPQRVRRRLPRAARWVVVAYDARPPELMDRALFLRRLEARR